MEGYHRFLFISLKDCSNPYQNIAASASGGAHDDSKLSKNWYKFDVPGKKNILPTYNPGTYM